MNRFDWRDWIVPAGIAALFVLLAIYGDREQLIAGAVGVFIAAH